MQYCAALYLEEMLSIEHKLTVLYIVMWANFMMTMYDDYDDYEVIVINALHTWLATILFDPLNWLFRFLSQAIAMRMDCKHDVNDMKYTD